MAEGDAGKVIREYRTGAIAVEAVDFAREVVGGLGPASVSRARALLFAAGRLGAFATGVGLALEPEVVFTTALIERFIATEGPAMSAGWSRTVRSNLFFLAEAIRPEPRPVRLSRGRAKAAYSGAEIAHYLAQAYSQPTPDRVRRAVGLIGLGAGAGLVGGDLRGVRGTHITTRSGGVVVEVVGVRARVVPVLSRYHSALLEVAAQSGDRYVIGGVVPERRNVTTALIDSLSGGLDLPRLEMTRLRASWLSELAENIGLAAFMAAAGVTCSQRLGDIVARQPVPDEAVMVEILGGGSG